MSTRSGQPGINSQEYGTLKVPAPSIKEQQKIVDMLSKSNQEIENLKSNVKILKVQKNGLMQKLLTGEVRVKI